MDCVACGKPISITAKFCGKCGAPVKRVAKPAEAALVNETYAEPVATPVEASPVDEMSFTLSPPEHMADMRDIDLELPAKTSHVAPSPATESTTDSKPEPVVSPVVNIPAPPPAPKEMSPSFELIKHKLNLYFCKTLTNFVITLS
jgi:hypothetical protein